jgi:branched-subunit amino acid transport protein
MIAWITLAAASVLTLALRAGPSLISGRGSMPQAVQRAQRLAAAALMGALASRSVAAQVTATNGTPVLIAVAAAVPVAVRSRSMATSPSPRPSCRRGLAPPPST